MDTNTNHVPFTALPASQPSVTFPVTSRNARSCARKGAARVDNKQWGGKKRDNLTNKSCEENTREKGEWRKRHDDVKNDLLIIHNHPALLMR